MCNERDVVETTGVPTGSSPSSTVTDRCFPATELYILRTSLSNIFVEPRGSRYIEVIVQRTLTNVTVPTHRARNLFYPDSRVASPIFTEHVGYFYRVEASRGTKYFAELAKMRRQFPLCGRRREEYPREEEPSSWISTRQMSYQ